jgi:hypothetical protein
MVKAIVWSEGYKMSNKTARVIAFLLVFLCSAYREAEAQTDVMIAVDLSGTMKINDPSGYRFIGADQFLSLFSLYGRNRGGAVAFGDTSREIMALEYVSFDRAGKYQNIFLGLGVDDWTELGKGLQLCLEKLGASPARRRGVILISDGIIEGNPQARAMSADDARRVAEEEVWNQIVPALVRADIRVYTVGLLRGDMRGEPNLKRIAEATGGFYTRVERPEEFSRIYKKMLDDIDQPAGVAQLPPGASSFPLTSADDGVIIIGPAGYTLIGPNGVAYSTESHTDSPVRNVPHKYSDGTAVIFLSRPEDMKSNSQYWTGSWRVIELKGGGEVTYLSPVDLAQGVIIPQRSAFFKNEYIPVEFPLGMRKGYNPEEFLSKCKGTYTIASMGSGTPRSISGDLSRTGNVFRGEALVEYAGDYMLQVELVCENTSYRKPRRRIRVSNAELVDLNFIYKGQALVGAPFKIEAKQNPNAFTNEMSELRGLTNGVINLNMIYDPAEKVPLPEVGENSPGGYTVDKDSNGNALAFDRIGKLTVDGVVSGNLVMQMQDAGGPAFTNVPVRVKVRREIDVKEDWLVMLQRYLPILVGFATVVFGAFEILLQWKYKRLDQMVLVGIDGTKDLANLGDGKSIKQHLFSAFRRKAYEDVGGPTSDASTKLNAGGNEKFVEIGRDWSNQYFIRRTGDRNVFLRNEKNVLEKDVEHPLNEGDDIMIEGIGKFRFQEELGL